MSEGRPSVVEPESWESATWALGAHIVGPGEVTFAVYAPAASRVELELYEVATGQDAFAWFELTRSTDGIWRGKLSGVEEGALYAYRCWGVNWPYDPEWARGGSAAGYVADFDDHGHRFNPNKALYDPYAREITHTLYSHLIAEAGADRGVFGTGDDDYQGRARREADSGPYVPKGIVIAEQAWTEPKPELPSERAVIYEAHAKGLTKHPTATQLSSLLSETPGFEGVQDVPDELRGTYAGAAHLAAYLTALGVTTIEFLPVHQSNGSDTAEAGSANWWGYQTMAFFAPNRDYAHDRSPGGPTREFREMVHRFHDAGIEVYLDVVFNHSAEGGNWSGENDTTGFVTLGGFATPAYYVLNDDLMLIDGATGCSNQFNFSSDVAQRLVLDSLVYWCDVMGVDGYRFDLAPVLGRTPMAFDREDVEKQRRFSSSHPLLGAIRDLAADRSIEVIAEAWDLWGYEVGNFPSGWGEWNGRYRDAMRAYLKGDANTQAFIDQFNGDWARFSDQGGPQQSVDFITAHDGFTLADLVSYNDKINDQPYPFGPSDGGSDSNLSWDSENDQTFRRQRVRNFLAVLFLSRGIPMIVSGDEYGRTQNGNNNPWCLDTIGIWNNWAAVGTNAPQQVPVDPDDAEITSHDNLGVAATPARLNPLLAFTAYLAALRNGHPGLRQRTYGDEELDEGDDVTYFFRGLTEGSSPGPEDRSLAVHIDCSEVGDTGDLFVCVNMADGDARFELPETSADRPWRAVIDTSAAHEDHANRWSDPLDFRSTSNGPLSLSNGPLSLSSGPLSLSSGPLSLSKGPLVDGSYVTAGWSIAVLANPMV